MTVPVSTRPRSSKPTAIVCPSGENTGQHPAPLMTVSPEANPVETRNRVSFVPSGSTSQVSVDPSAPLRVNAIVPVPSYPSGAKSPADGLSVDTGASVAAGAVATGRPDGTGVGVVPVAGSERAMPSAVRLPTIRTAITAAARNGEFDMRGLQAIPNGRRWRVRWISSSAPNRTLSARSIGPSAIQASARRSKSWSWVMRGAPASHVPGGGRPRGPPASTSGRSAGAT